MFTVRFILLAAVAIMVAQQLQACRPAAPLVANTNQLDASTDKDEGFHVLEVHQSTVWILIILAGFCIIFALACYCIYSHCKLRFGPFRRP